MKKLLFLVLIIVFVFLVAHSIYRFNLYFEIKNSKIEHLNEDFFDGNFRAKDTTIDIIDMNLYENLFTRVPVDQVSSFFSTLDSLNLKESFPGEDTPTKSTYVISIKSVNGNFETAHISFYEPNRLSIVFSHFGGDYKKSGDYYYENDYDLKKFLDDFTSKYKIIQAN
jgi:hypothetical protein